MYKTNTHNKLVRLSVHESSENLVALMYSKRDANEFLKALDKSATRLIQ